MIFIQYRSIMANAGNTHVTSAVTITTFHLISAGSMASGVIHRAANTAYVGISIGLSTHDNICAIRFMWQLVEVDGICSVILTSAVVLCLDFASHACYRVSKALAVFRYCTACDFISFPGEGCCKGFVA